MNLKPYKNYHENYDEADPMAVSQTIVLLKLSGCRIRSRVHDTIKVIGQQEKIKQLMKQKPLLLTWDGNK